MKQIPPKRNDNHCSLHHWIEISVRYTFFFIINCLTLYFIVLKNGQTYFKNLAVFTPQDV